MDAPRRWQVASLATAVAGLGLGSLMVGRSPSVEVEPIDLDAAAVSSTTDEPTFRLPVPDPPEIVPPRVREDRLTPGDSVASAEPASPDEPVTSTSRERVSEVPEPTPPSADDDDQADDDRADDDGDDRADDDRADDDGDDRADDDPEDDDGDDRADDDDADDDVDPATAVDSPDEVDD